MTQSTDPALILMQGKNPFEKECASIKKLIHKELSIRHALHIAIYELAKKCRSHSIMWRGYFEQYVPEIFEIYAPTTINKYVNTSPQDIRSQQKRQRIRKSSISAVDFAKSAFLKMSINDRWLFLDWASEAMDSYIDRAA